MLDYKNSRDILPTATCKRGWPRSTSATIQSRRSPFREVLARNPTRYGATLQLAKALDRSGRPDEALEAWKKILAMAEAVSDADTIGTARARIGSR